jgi:uncharacterized protein YegP (UPF0339 family)
MSKIWIDIHKNINATQKYWFTIETNGNKLAHSEMYYNKSDCISAAKLIVEHAGDAVVYDETGDIKSTDIHAKMIV